MRALAVLAVIVFHVDAQLLPGGFTGVDLFFVISGFVISQSLAARGDTPPGTLLLDFYRRRVLRLLPRAAADAGGHVRAVGVADSARMAQ